MDANFIAEQTLHTPLRANGHRSSMAAYGLPRLLARTTDLGENA